MNEDVKPLDAAAKPDHARLIDDLEKLVDTWHFDSFHGSVVARDTEIWNWVHVAKEDLKRRLARLF